VHRDEGIKSLPLLDDFFSDRTYDKAIVHGCCDFAIGPDWGRWKQAEEYANYGWPHKSYHLERVTAILNHLNL
jgi:hypothetical protein